MKHYTQLLKAWAVGLGELASTCHSLERIFFSKLRDLKTRTMVCESYDSSAI